MKLRTTRFALLLSIVAALSIVGPVSASSGGASVTNTRGYAGALSWLGNFSASWGVVKANQDGTQVWKVTPVSMTNVVILGKDCSPEICESWSAGANIKFLNASGTQVGITIYPSPGGACNSFVIDQRDLGWGFCRTGFYMAPISATQVKVTWTVNMYRADGFTFTPFNVVRTVKLF